MKPSSSSKSQTLQNPQSRKHLRLGWWLILVFLTLGIVLESLHGFKVLWYLDLSNSTRRLMFTLAHSHGTLLGILNVVFALTIAHIPNSQSARLRLAGKSLMIASALMPTGFFLGGFVIYGGDPGLGILLVPVGALFLFAAVFLTARAIE